MNPVAMHEVNKARHQDLERAAEGRRQARAGSPGRSGLVSSLLEKVRGWAGRARRQRGLQPEEKRGVSPAAR